MSRELGRRELLATGLAGVGGIGGASLAGSWSDDTEPRPDDTTPEQGSPAISVDSVVRTGSSTYDVTFVYAKPDGARVERSRFVSGTSTAEAPRELDLGRHSFTVRWTPTNRDERLIWEVRFEDGEPMRAVTLPHWRTRERWTLTLSELRNRFTEFDPTAMTVRTDAGETRSIRMRSGRKRATFRVRDGDLVSYRSGGKFWEVAVDPAELVPTTVQYDVSDQPDHANRYTFTMANSPFDGTQRMSHVVSERSHWGANVYYFFPDHGEATPGLDRAQPDEVYSRIRVRLRDGWNQPTRTDTCKILWAGCNLSAGNAGNGGRPPTGDDGWSVRVYTRGPDDDGTVSLGSYVYHLDQRGEFGVLSEWPDRIRIGEWNRIDAHVKLNSVTNGSANADGVLRTRLNGTLQNERTDLRWRTTPALGFDRIGPGTYWGGSEVSPRDNVVDFDDYRFAVGGDSLD